MLVRNRNNKKGVNAESGTTGAVGTTLTQRSRGWGGSRNTNTNNNKKDSNDYNGSDNDKADGTMNNDLIGGMMPRWEHPKEAIESVRTLKLPKGTKSKNRKPGEMLIAFNTDSSTSIGDLTCDYTEAIAFAGGGVPNEYTEDHHEPTSSNIIDVNGNVISSPVRIRHPLQKTTPLLSTLCESPVKKNNNSRNIGHIGPVMIDCQPTPKTRNVNAVQPRLGVTANTTGIKEFVLGNEQINLAHENNSNKIMAVVPKDVSAATFLSGNSTTKKNNAGNKNNTDNEIVLHDVTTTTTATNSQENDINVSTVQIDYNHVPLTPAFGRKTSSSSTTSSSSVSSSSNTSTTNTTNTTRRPGGRRFKIMNNNSQQQSDVVVNKNNNDDSFSTINSTTSREITFPGSDAGGFENNNNTNNNVEMTKSNSLQNITRTNSLQNMNTNHNTTRTNSRRKIMMRSRTNSNMKKRNNNFRPLPLHHEEEEVINSNNYQCTNNNSIQFADINTINKNNSTGSIDDINFHSSGDSFRQNSSRSIDELASSWHSTLSNRYIFGSDNSGDKDNHNNDNNNNNNNNNITNIIELENSMQNGNAITSDDCSHCSQSIHSMGVFGNDDDESAALVEQENELLRLALERSLHDNCYTSWDESFDASYGTRSYDNNSINQVNSRSYHDVIPSQSRYGGNNQHHDNSCKEDDDGEDRELSRALALSASIMGDNNDNINNDPNYYKSSSTADDDMSRYNDEPTTNTGIHHIPSSSSQTTTTSPLVSGACSTFCKDRDSGLWYRTAPDLNGTDLLIGDGMTDEEMMIEMAKEESLLQEDASSMLSTTTSSVRA